MQSAIALLKVMDFDTSSPVRTIQQVRERINNAASPIGEAQYIVNDLIGLNVEFADLATALHVAQYVVYDAMTLDSIVAQDVVDNAFKRTAKLFENQPWAKPVAQCDTQQETIAVVSGIETKVAVKANGKIKKGGKQVLAVELYKMHVVNTPKPLTNQEFIAMLMKELDMTKPGATTYAYNCKKQFST